ncbi:hypothetical protein ACFE04_028856 [Oxalis oulophora]
MLIFTATSFPAVIGFHHQSVDFACLPLTTSGSHPWFLTWLRFLHGWAFQISASSDLGPVSPGAVNSGFVDLGLVSAQGQFSVLTPCFAHSHDAEADLGLCHLVFDIRLASTSKLSSTSSATIPSSLPSTFARSRDIGQFDIPMSRRLRATTSLVSVSSRPPNVSTSLCHGIDIDASRQPDIDLGQPYSTTSTSSSLVMALLNSAGQEIDG